MEGDLVMFPEGMNASTLLTLIHSLSPQAREVLFQKLNMNSDDLRDLVNGFLKPAGSTAIEESDRMKYPEYRAHKLLRLYIPPVLLLLGTLGNIFSFLILRHKAMARQSTHHFLAALAVVDSLVLYIGLFRKWLGDLTGYDPQNQSVWLCKGIVMLGYCCSNVSVWIIVAVTVERYIVVCHPLKATLVCNVTRAKRVVVAIAGLFLIINLHFLWTAGITQQQQKQGGSSDQQHSPVCNSEEGHEFLITAVWPWVDALLYGFGPFVIIFVLNIFIIVHVIRATSGRMTLQNRFSGRSPIRKTCSHNGSQYTLVPLDRSTSNGSVNSANGTNSSSSSSGSSNSSNSNNNNNNNNNTNNNNNMAVSSPNLTVPGTFTPGQACLGMLGKATRSQAHHSHNNNNNNNPHTQRRFASHTNLRLTVMLLAVSFTFLLTTLPMNVSIIASAFWNQNSGDLERMSKFRLVFTVAELLMYLNHSVNFFLYCATGHKFRSEMIRMVCGKQRPNAMISDHSQHLYCSRTCVVNGLVEARNIEETVL